MASNIWNGSFWRDAVERAVSTAAQSALALVGADAISSAFDLDYKAIAGVSLLAAGLAILKALAASYKEDTVSPASLVKPAPPKGDA
jgi:hypothetical protein